MFERTFTSRTAYADPFNEIEVDAIFARDGTSWRVPAFWRGGGDWAVRFTPPAAGEFDLHLACTDPRDAGLNGHACKVRIERPKGPLWDRGMLRVSDNGRHFCHADGTPFFWLGDTWWAGLSDRLPWDGFRRLTEDRAKKGFTVIQTVAGLAPFEEAPPLDPGCSNEGGPVWEDGFTRINPRYFDFADRRIEHLVRAGMVPAIVGGWNALMRPMGVAKMKQHWRNILARYGAYPVIWLLGGELYDPPDDVALRWPGHVYPTRMQGWTEVAAYVRATDPMHHPFTAHEATPPFDSALQDETLTDFDMFQPSHFGWPSIATEVAQLNKHYARTHLTKPIVVGEVGYENLGGIHQSDFQRAAFWLAMLNGAAGFTYGADGVWESYTGDKPLHRIRWSFTSWEEGMDFRGAREIALGAGLLRDLPWWEFAPRPDWITPRGTTMLEPHDRTAGFDIDVMSPHLAAWSNDPLRLPPDDAGLPRGEWQDRRGNARLPYAAGIPGAIRVVYSPGFGLLPPAPPTILKLEPGVRYRAYYWQPSLGIKVDLGVVARPKPGAVISQGSPTAVQTLLHGDGMAAALSADAVGPDIVAEVETHAGANIGLILGYRDDANYVAAHYSERDKAVRLIDRAAGQETCLAEIPIPILDGRVTLAVEMRDGFAAASISDGRNTQTTPIVKTRHQGAGRAGVVRDAGRNAPMNFVLRESPVLAPEERPDPVLRDVAGAVRGDLNSPGWETYGRQKRILLDAYLPERFPASGDWLLVMDAEDERAANARSRTQRART